MNGQSKQSVVGSRRIAIGIAVVGLALLALMWVFNRRLELRPVYVLIPIAEGESCEATFIPTHSDRYELEVEMRKPADKDAFEKCIRTTESGALDAAWTVHADGKQIASGDLTSYLYLSMTGPNRRRVRQAVGLESYHDVGTFRMSRGIGRFRATAGQQITIRLNTNSTVPSEFAVGEPRLVVRVNRRLAAQYLDFSMAIAVGVIVIVGGWLFLHLVWRKKPGRSPTIPAE